MCASVSVRTSNASKSKVDGGNNVSVCTRVCVYVCTSNALKMEWMCV